MRVIEGESSSEAIARTVRMAQFAEDLGYTRVWFAERTAPGLLQPGGSYSFSMQLKLAAGTATTQARFVLEPAYTWVGNTTVSADKWTTVTGSFTAPSDAAAGAVRAYIGTGSLDRAYDYLVDDLKITGTPAAGGGTCT